MRQTVYAEHHQLISQREVCLFPGLSTQWEAWDIGKLWRVEVVVILHGQAEAHDGEPGRDSREEMAGYAVQCYRWGQGAVLRELKISCIKLWLN